MVGEICSNYKFGWALSILWNVKKWSSARLDSHRQFASLAISIAISVSTQIALATQIQPEDAENDFFLQNYLAESKFLGDEEFYRKFPYEKYLSNVDLANFSFLEHQRSTVDQHQRNGEVFVVRVFRNYLDLNPIDLTAMSDLIRIIDLADKALNFHVSNGYDSSIYENIAYILLDDLADTVQDGINSGVLIDSGDVKFLVSELRMRDYVIDVPTSRFYKLKKHIKNRNWMYIWNRLKLDYFNGLLIGFVVFGFLILMFSKRLIERILSPKRQDFTP